MFYYMITCIRPSFNTGTTLAKRIRKAIANIKGREKLKELLAKMLAVDENDRPDFMQLEQWMI